MKIVIVTKTFPPFSYGGTESFTEQLASELSLQKGFDVHVICFRSAEQPVPEERVVDYRKSHDFTLHTAGLHHKDSSLVRDLRNWLRIRKQLQRTISAIQPDIIQTVGVYSETILAVSIGRKLKIPTNIFPRGSDINREHGWVTSTILKTFAFRRASMIMCQTDWAKDQLIAKGFMPADPSSPRTLIVPNAIHLITEETNGNSPLDPVEDQGPSSTVLWIGRFEPVKRPSLAIDAFRLAHPSLPGHTELIMIGDGSEMNSILSLVSGRDGGSGRDKCQDDDHDNGRDDGQDDDHDNGRDDGQDDDHDNGRDNVRNVKDSIHIPGRMTPQEIREHLRKGTILINTSSSEGFPQTFLEAMSYGLPIICFDVAANREIIVDGVNGFVIPQDDLNAFSEAIVTLINDAVLWDRIVQNNLDVVKKYSWSEVLPRIIEAYDSLIKQD